MRSESRKYDPNVNIVTWSGVATGEDEVEGEQLESESWFGKDREKNVGFDLGK